MKNIHRQPLWLTFFLSLLFFSTATASATEPTISYVTSIHPLAAILQEVTTGRATVSCLLNPTGSPHTFEPTPSDLKGIESARAFFFGGAGLDGEWVAKLPIQQKISLLDLVPEDSKLPMISKHEHHHGTKHHKEEGITDPHFWLDPHTVKAMVPQLVKKLAEIDPEGRLKYNENGKKFTRELELLDREMGNILKPVAHEQLLLFHPSFNYLFHRYNLRSAGAIVKSPGHEPGPKFLIKMIKQIKKEKIKALFTEPQLASQPAQVLAESANIPLYELDPLGGVAGRKTYREIMLYNCTTISNALK